MINQTTGDKYLKKLRPILRIEDWNIELKVQDPTTYAAEHAELFAYETYGITRIVNDADVTIHIRADLSPLDFISTLIHECVHLVTHRYDEFVTGTLTHVDSKKIAKVFKNEALWEMEILVNRITTILKPLIKL